MAEGDRKMERAGRPASTSWLHSCLQVIQDTRSYAAWGKKLSLYLAVAAFYIGGCGFSLLLRFKKTDVIPVWIPSGINIVFVLMLGCHIWPGIFIGALCGIVWVLRVEGQGDGAYDGANSKLSGGVLFAAAIFIAAGNTLEAYIGGYLLRSYLGSSNRNRPFVNPSATVASSCSLLAYGALAPLSSSLIRSLVRCIAVSNSWSDFGTIFHTWYLAEVAAIFYISSSIFLLLLPPIRPPRPRNMFLVGLEMAALLALTTILSVFTLGGQDPTNGIFLYLYLILSPIMWTVFRFPRKGSGLLLLVLGTMSLVGASTGISQIFQRADNRVHQILHVQLFVCTISILVLLASASVREAAKAMFELGRLAATLEERVQQRTLELQTTMEELRKAKQTAEAASKAKSEFLSQMSHEIRTPIHGILGMVALALDSTLTAEQRGFLETVQQSGDALLSIINDILDISKIEAGMMELENVPFSIQEMLSPTMRLLQVRAAQQGVRLQWKISPDVPNYVLGDPGRLNQCVLNIVGNAIKFTPGFGANSLVNMSVSVQKDKFELASSSLSTRLSSEITIARGGSQEVALDILEEAGSRGGEEEALRVPEGETYTGTYGDVYLRFSVADTGIGIPKDKQAKIFESFRQADNSMTRQFGGTGLGLSITSSLVKMMGGHIWVESIDKHGSTFHFTVHLKLTQPSSDSSYSSSADITPLDTEILEQYIAKAGQAKDPLKEKKPSLEPRVVESRLFKAEASKGGVQENVEKAEGGYAILLAEDNPVNQRVASAMLVRKGCSVEIVSDGQQVLDLYKSHRNKFDVILMDLSMPVLDGLQATAAIRDHERKLKLPPMPIIGVTAHALQGYKELCSKHGMDGYVSKPFNVQKLLATIASVIRRNSTRRPPSRGE